MVWFLPSPHPNALRQWVETKCLVHSKEHKTQTCTRIAKPKMYSRIAQRQRATKRVELPIPSLSTMVSKYRVTSTYQIGTNCLRPELTFRTAFPLKCRVQKLMEVVNLVRTFVEGLYTSTLPKKCSWVSSFRNCTMHVCRRLKVFYWARAVCCEQTAQFCYSAWNQVSCLLCKCQNK